MNLYSNAIKFTDKKGKITVIVEKINYEEGSQLIVSVADCGLGIKKKDKNKIFQLFGSIKNEK